MVGLFVLGKWQGSVKIKMWFTAGGAIEFGQAMLRAGQLGIYHAFNEEEIFKFL